jgi:hypothetical protein
MDNTDPQRTIDLLGELEHLGFNDAAFERLHHFWQHSSEQRHHTMYAHRSYCVNLVNNGARFRADGNNARTQHRLELVLEVKRYHIDNPSALPALADAAVSLIPFLPLRTAP